MDEKNMEYAPEHPLSQEILDFLKSKQPLTFYDLKAIADDIKTFAVAKVFDTTVEL